MAMVGQAVKQCSGHFWIAKHTMRSKRGTPLFLVPQALVRNLSVGLDQAVAHEDLRAPQEMWKVVRAATL